jgi:hypothetical protein
LQYFQSSFAAREYWKKNLVNLEGVKLAGAVAIHGLTNAGNKVSQLGLVVLPDHGASYSSL